MTTAWLAAGVAMAAPSAAGAATLSAAPNPEMPGYETIAYYNAAPGEINDVRVSALDEHSIRLVDLGAMITASPPCQLVDVFMADCANGGPSGPNPNYFFTAELTLGDGGDTVAGTDVVVRAVGGAGDDTLFVAGGGAGEFTGGPGRDELHGGEHADAFIDGQPSGAGDADLVLGGGDRDVVSYQGRTRGVRVDLRDARPDGERGEHDLLRSIESVIGGDGDDDLAGSGRPYSTLDGQGGDDLLRGGAGGEFLDGGPGADRLRGGHGDDSLRGGAGADRLDGGDGNDMLFPAGGRDEIVCGAGFDDVRARPATRIRGGCETATLVFRAYGDRSALSVTPYPHRDNRAAVTFRFFCPTFQDLDGGSRPITATFTLREPSQGRLLGRGHTSRTAGMACGVQPEPKSLTARVKLTDLGRRQAATPAGVWATVRMRGRNLPQKGGWTIRLRGLR